MTSFSNQDHFNSNSNHNNNNNNNDNKSRTNSIHLLNSKESDIPSSTCLNSNRA